MREVKIENYKYTKEKRVLVTLAQLFNRDHGGIQTPDRWSRNPVLYSAELRGHYMFKLILILQLWK